MLTNDQIAAINNARIAREFAASYVTNLVNSINASMQTAWGVESERFFDTLGTDAGAIWTNNGKRIAFALSLGADYADIAKPSRICCVCADGNVVPTGVAFPDTPLASWGVPVADKAAALALIAAESATPGAILAALIAAQPAP